MSSRFTAHLVHFAMQPLTFALSSLLVTPISLRSSAWTKASNTSPQISLSFSFEMYCGMDSTDLNSSSIC